MATKLLAEEVNICAGFVPVDMAAGANSGDWVSLKNYRHVSIVLFKAAGAVGEPAVITVQQATDVAGTGAKALNFTRVDHKSGADIFTVGAYTKVTQAAANTYSAVGGAGNTQAIVQIDFNAEDLDADGGFDCIRATIADPGATAQLGALFYILTGPRYTPMQSAIVD